MCEPVIVHGTPPTLGNGNDLMYDLTHARFLTDCDYFSKVTHSDNLTKHFISTVTDLAL